MPVKILDLQTGQIVALSALAGTSRVVSTFELTSGGTRPLSEFIARPDTLKFLDISSGAALTYNQALAADGGLVPATALTFSDGIPLQFSDGSYLELAA